VKSLGDLIALMMHGSLWACGRFLASGQPRRVQGGEGKAAYDFFSYRHTFLFFDKDGNTYVKEVEEAVDAKGGRPAPSECEGFATMQLCLLSLGARAVRGREASSVALKLHSATKLEEAKQPTT